MHGQTQIKFSYKSSKKEEKHSNCSFVCFIHVQINTAIQEEWNYYCQRWIEVSGQLPSATQPNYKADPDGNNTRAGRNGRSSLLVLAFVSLACTGRRTRTSHWTGIPFTPNDTARIRQLRAKTPRFSMECCKIGLLTWLIATTGCITTIYVGEREVHFCIRIEA
jgi:hypothetical protein